LKTNSVGDDRMVLSAVTLSTVMSFGIAGVAAFLMRLTGEKHAPNQKRWSDSFACVEGTGKYVGVSCSETDLMLGNEFPEAPDGTYVQHSAVQGTYKLK
jgi:hypothetical protein